MKYITYSVLLLSIISCSPKYTASFQDVDHSYRTSLDGINTQLNDVSVGEAGTIPEEKGFIASTESGPNELKRQLTIFSKVEKEHSSQRQPSVEFIRHQREEIKTVHTPRMESPKEGNPKKNGSAAIGFVLGLISLIPLYGMLAVIPAIIFSIIGLKSEKRKLAIAGLVLASIGIGIVIFIVSFSL